MTEEELWDAIDGLFAYDTGCVDSGIRDESLRAQVIAQLKASPPGVFDLMVARQIRDRCLSEPALEAGYGIEDALSLLRWLEGQLGWDFDLPRRWGANG